MAIGVSKEQSADADPKAIQSIYFTGNLIRGQKADGEIINLNKTMFYIIEETKETILDFSQETVKVL